MPGVPGSEAEAVAAQLKDVSRIVNQETAQLVDALMNLTLDAEENNKTIARMSLDSSLTKATVDEQARTIQRCEDRQADEARRRTALEDELAAATEVLYGGNWSKVAIPSYPIPFHILSYTHADRDPRSRNASTTLKASSTSAAPSGPSSSPTTRAW